MNGILRGKDKTDWSMDGKAVNVEGVLLPSEYTPPRGEDKLDLFEKLLKNSKEMTQGQRSNEDLALLVASTINAVHAFADANGRTSRLAYILLKDGFNEQIKELLRKALSEDGREIVDPNPSFVRHELEQILLYKPLSESKTKPMSLLGIFFDKTSTAYEFKEAIPDKLRELFFQISRDDSDYFRIAILEHVYRTGNPTQYVETFPKEPDNLEQSDMGDGGFLKRERTVVVLSKLTPELDVVAIESIISRYWKLKKEYVELMMDSIANPDKPEYKIETDSGQPVRIIDLFKSEIINHSSGR